MRTALLLAGLLLTLPGAASHQWAGIDLCEVRKDVVPPGLPTALLPEAQSRGAQLLQQYCTQCHNLPGPGRHTAQAWPQVAERMFLLMEVSERFGGLLGKISTPTEKQRELLQGYLQRHALKPWNQAASPPPDYQAACSSCHVLPDPSQHSPREWQAVLHRMAQHADTMGKPPISADTLFEAASFLGVRSPNPGTTHSRSGSSSRSSYYGTGLALGPFLMLTLLGLLRWRQGMKSKTRPCVTR